MGGVFSRRLCFAAILGIAAVAGYGWGISHPRAGTPEGSERRISARARNGSGPRPAPDLTDEEFMRRVLYGRIGEREQWRRIRTFSEDQAKAAIAALGNPTPPWESPAHQTKAMLYARWAEFDPAAANAAARQVDPDGFSLARVAVMTAWIKRDDAAAWKATEDEEQVWACVESVRGDTAEMLVASFSDFDDATALRKAAALDDLEDENLLVSDLLVRTRAPKVAVSPESRAAFLAAIPAHPSEYIRSKAYEALFLAWADREPEAALEGVNGAHIPEGQRERLRGAINSLMDLQKATGRFK